MALGQGTHTYDYAENWGGLCDDYHEGWIPGVACDSMDRVFVYSRSQKPLNVYDRDGSFLETWGEGVLEPNLAHGIVIDLDDNVYVTDATTHCVHKFDSSGQLEKTLGSPGRPGTNDGDPFNRPTDIALDSEGNIFISDGYGNARIHKYSSDGEHLLSWGDHGDKPGQFSISHSVRIDRQDRVWSCDRENCRLQIFDANGNFLDSWENLLRPNNIFIHPDEDLIYIAELGRRIGIFTMDKELVSSWGGGGDPSDTPGEFLGGPHGIWVDSRGDIYAGEVELGKEGRLHKYIRRH
jgi:sugar lactone lactonase YvrE